MRLWRYIKYYFIKFKRLQGNPHALAGGTAIGVLIGLTPTMPLHTVLIVVFSLLTRTSTVAGIIVSWIVCNPLTYLPIYYLSAVIGNYLTPYELNLHNVKETVEKALGGSGFQNTLTTIMDSGYQLIVVLGVGGFVFALPFAVVSYYLSLRFFVKIQQKRLKKHVLD